MNINLSARFFGNHSPILVAALIFVAAFFSFVSPTALRAQNVSATLKGIVTDQNGALLPGVTIKVLNSETGFQRQVLTNENGFYTFPALPPATYVVNAGKEGFAPIEINNVALNVNDLRELPIQMKVGGVAETVDVEASTVTVEQSPAVATTIDQNLVSRLPLNGRTIQNLIALTPGALGVNPITAGSPGQISVNGLRTTQNYLTIDGTSANIQASTRTLGVGQIGGNLPGFSQNGTTSNLVSVEALQEFKVQTSSYSAEFGRMPGAQIQLTTRSGNNDYHGSAYEYFRNDKLDASDWFVNANKLTKPPLRHNLFGVTFSGPVPFFNFGEGGKVFHSGKDRTFFFFNYEGTRIRLPQVANVNVTSRLVRQTAAAAFKPFFSTVPEPTGPDAANGLTAPFTYSYSNPQEQDATGLRIDHHLNKQISIFGRFNYSPQENGSLAPQSSRSTTTFGITKTFTAGSTVVFTPKIVNETRFNWSYSLTRSNNKFVSVNGTTDVPEATARFSPYFTNKSSLTLVLPGLFYNNQPQGGYGDLKQINLTDTLSWTPGNHLIKFGFDYRQSRNSQNMVDYFIQVTANTLSAIQTGVASNLQVSSNTPLYTRFLWRNAGAFAQDTWKVNKRLTLDLGLRWDVNPPPDTDPQFRYVILDYKNPATLAPVGTRLYPTKWNGFAPRLGAAYLLREKSGQELVIRGGYGMFYDLGSGSFGNLQGYFPQSAAVSINNVQFPFANSVMVPPQPSLNPPISATFLTVFDQGYSLPRVYQWNLTVEQALGKNQTLTVGYVGNAGRKLLRLAFTTASQYPIASPLFAAVTNFNMNTNREGFADSSDYNGMQVQFNRRGKNLNALVNYTWSHAIDTASGHGSATSPFAIPVTTERGNSSFDRRHIFSTAMTWNLPSIPKGQGGLGSFANYLTKDWTLDGIFQAQSAFPIEIGYFSAGNLLTTFTLRPNLVEGQPLWIEDTSAGAGRRLNPAAFSIPPTFGQQGNLPRNFIRAFSLWQPDIALGRVFRFSERMKLQLKAEVFNFVNHPNFASPNAQIGSRAPNGAFTPSALFGRVTTMLNRVTNSEGASLTSIYQVGGPRSIQLSAKFSF